MSPRMLSAAERDPEPVRPAPLIGNPEPGHTQPERDDLEEGVGAEQEPQHAEGGGDVAEHHGALKRLRLGAVEPFASLGHRIILSGRTE